jgi:hypothetical protein
MGPIFNRRGQFQVKQQQLRCHFGLAIIVFFTIAFAQNLTPEMQADVDQRVTFQRKWDGRLNSPDAELRGIVAVREEVGKGVYVLKYEFQAKGLPTELDYELLMLPTMAASSKDFRSTGDVHIDKNDGRVIDGPNDPRSIILPDPAPGEPYRFALISKDGKYKAYLSLVPNPIEARDGSCTVSVVRLMPHFELAFLRATGFPPQTEIAVHGNSEGEIHDFKVKTNESGYLDAGVLPFKLAKSKGKMEMRFTAATCAPKVSFKWGSTEDGKPYQ